MKVLIVLLIVQMGAGYAGLFAAGGQAATTQQEEASPPTVKQQRAVHELCHQAMLQIRSEIHHLARDFKPLSDFDEPSITGTDAVDAKTHAPLPIYQTFRYHKNVRTENTKPDAQGNVPQAGQRYIVQKNGAQLEVYLYEGPIAAPQTKSYALPVRFHDRVLYLQYYLEENPANPEMEKAIQNVMDSQAEVLSNKLKDLEPVRQGDSSSARQEQTARALVVVIHQAEMLLQDPHLSATQRHAAQDLYEAAWTAALHYTQVATAPGAEKDLLAAWDEALGHERDGALLSHAFTTAGASRVFLTPAMQNLFNTTQDVSILKSVSYWVAKQGDTAEAQLLRDRIRTLANPEQQEILQNALNWMAYWRTGNHPPPGPAALAPSPG